MPRLRIAHRLLFAILALLGPSLPAASALPRADDTHSAGLSVGDLSLDLSRAMLQAAAPQPGDAASSPPAAAAEPPPAEAAPLLTRRGRPRKAYGRAGSEWLTFGAAIAYNLEEETDFNLHAAYSQFLADELEFGIELGGWYFAQDRRDTGGLSASMLLRWHHWHADDFSWTFFSDVGIGILAGFEEVPQGGQRINFLPRIGLGYTQRIGDEGSRLMLGARWHHISNGRYAGDSRNPSRDSVMLYAALVVPF